MKRLFAATWLLPWLAAPATADLNIPGADGSDGTFAPSADTTVDLSLATTATWDAPGTGNGVYDPEKWAVVFKYDGVTIPAGVYVRFKNHPSGAPVVWLVNGDADIHGTVNLNGADHTRHPDFAEPGPGGFPGGSGKYSNEHGAGGGFGIGGGSKGVSGGSHATGGNSDRPTYGSIRVLPLIGGSGGGGDSDENFGGAAGGGALLLAVAGTLRLDGQIGASGGHGYANNPWNAYQCSGSGAGGAVRIAAERIEGSGRVIAKGRGQCSGSSGWGRVRIEAQQPNASWDVNPVTSIIAPDDPVLLWPPQGAPEVRIVSIDTAAAPADPRPSFNPGQEDVTIPLAEESTIVLDTAYVAPDASVRVRVTPAYGNPFFIDAVQQTGGFEQATWTATASLPTGYFTLQAHAVNPEPKPESEPEPEPEPQP